mmetsp:Transcript_20386/g.20097  ORF Transcript_20386/g.20097 Transcript_20386/m.20097 type:complete len:137 (+) Transcript_20386:702-1112(+)
MLTTTLRVTPTVASITSGIMTVKTATQSERLDLEMTNSDDFLATTHSKTSTKEAQLALNNEETEDTLEIMNVTMGTFSMMTAAVVIVSGSQDFHESKAHLQVRPIDMRYEEMAVKFWILAMTVIPSMVMAEMLLAM